MASGSPPRRGVSIGPFGAAARARRANRRPGARAVVALLAALGALVAGCGGGGARAGVANLGASGGSGSDRGSSSMSRSTHAGALAYANCVRHHGVPLWPDPDSQGRFEKSELTPRKLGVSRLTAGIAAHACRSLLPTYSATQQAQVVTQALRFSRCMRAHGATGFPDPQSNGAIRIPHAMESAPAYLAALHFCIHRYGVPPPPTPAGS